MRGTLGVSVSTLAAEHQTDWDLHPSFASWEYRTSPQSSTRLSLCDHVRERHARPQGAIHALYLPHGLWMVIA